MSILLYKAPNCLRCKITKEFMADHNIAYDSFDLEEDKDVVNKFYRENRARLYRNAEGAEFPMFHDVDQDEIRQGTGLILAWLLSGKGFDNCVSRSDLLHGWISGLNLSRCPDGQEDKFLELVRLLATGGLKVFMVSDGRKPELLEKMLAENLVSKMVLNVYGPADVYPDAGAQAPSQDDLGKSINLVRQHANGVIRLWLTPLTRADGSQYYISPEQAGEAAKMVLKANGDVPTLPFGIQADPEKVKGLEPLGDNLLPYRAKVRNSLAKAEILKEDA
jgi:hypothetical protein